MPRVAYGWGVDRVGRWGGRDGRKHKGNISPAFFRTNFVFEMRFKRGIFKRSGAPDFGDRGKY